MAPKIITKPDQCAACAGRETCTPERQARPGLCKVGTISPKRETKVSQSVDSNPVVVGTTEEKKTEIEGEKTMTKENKGVEAVLEAAMNNNQKTTKAESEFAKAVMAKVTYRATRGAMQEMAEEMPVPDGITFGAILKNAAAEATAIGVISYVQAKERYTSILQSQDSYLMKGTNLLLATCALPIDLLNLIVEETICALNGIADLIHNSIPYARKGHNHLKSGLIKIQDAILRGPLEFIKYVFRIAKLIVQNIMSLLDLGVKKLIGGVKKTATKIRGKAAQAADMVIDDPEPAAAAAGA